MNIGATPLFVASENGHEYIAELLLAKRASVNNAMNDGTTPLLIACQNGYEDIAKLLLANGANLVTDE